MSRAEPARAEAAAGAAPRPEPREPAGLGAVLPAAEVERALGQTIREALDLSGWDPDEGDGRTLFDTPQSEDGTILVVFPQAKFDVWRSQALAKGLVAVEPDVILGQATPALLQADAGRVWRFQ